MKSMRLQHIVLSTSVALNAAAAMVVEIVAGRLMAPYFGMSLYTWTTVIGVVLAGLTLGHWIGGRLAEKVDILKAMAWAFAGGAVATLLVLPILKLVAIGLGQGVSSLGAAIALTGFAAFFLPSFLAGLIQPLATKFALDLEGRTAGPVIGRMLAAGAFGSIAGTFLAGFLLISYLGSSTTLLLIAGVNALLALVFLTGRQRVWGAVILAATSIFMLVFAPAQLITTPCHEESNYYCIQVDETDFISDRPGRLMALDHLVHSINDRDDPQYLESPYLHFVDEVARLSFGEKAINAFFVGGGAYTLPRAWQSRQPQSQLTIAEIDPVVTQMAIEKLWYTPSDNTHIINRDARFTLRFLGSGYSKTKSKYDIIFGDAFHDIAIPPHLVTDEFNQLVAINLKANGIYALNVIDNPNSMAFLLSMIRTLRLSFSHVQTWYSPMDIGGGDRATFILLASQEPLNLAKIHKAVYGAPRMWARLNDSKYDVEGKGFILRDDYVPVDRLLSDFWFSGHASGS